MNRLKKNKLNKAKNKIENIDDNFSLRNYKATWFVYIIGFRKNNIPNFAYVGITSNLKRRFQEHYRDRGRFEVLKVEKLGFMTYEEAEKYEDAYYVLINRRKVKIFGSHFRLAKTKRSIQNLIYSQELYKLNCTYSDEMISWIKEFKAAKKNKIIS